MTVRKGSLALHRPYVPDRSKARLQCGGICGAVWSFCMDSRHVYSASNAEWGPCAWSPALKRPSPSGLGCANWKAVVGWTEAQMLFTRKENHGAVAGVSEA